MENFNRKNHWETIYNTKDLKDVSWYQEKPETSLGLIDKYARNKSETMIDIGGGDSYLADYLIDDGYTDITVLDISEKALEKAKTRLGEKAHTITWIHSDIIEFKPGTQYDIWHDRAAFHFLTKDEEIQQYIRIVTQAIKPEGIVIIGTFSETGPKKCSGIEIKQYSEQSLQDCFGKHFTILEIIHTQHNTPFNTVQDFIFCVMRKNIS